VHAPPLASLAFPPHQSRGRRYPEPAHPYRTDFQRDRDRLIHARAFRRLEDKTQVFTDPVSDHFRNRLTHTIEVTQIARTAARALGLNEDLTEALALAHDLGHPPFGHAGEAALDRKMRAHGARFDHNMHALRLVETFEQRYARFPGLNLTFEVREGMAKHSRDFEPGEFPALDEYLPGLRPPLEAQLIDLADEIAYNTADLDDGFAARLFDAAGIASAVPLYAEVAETVEFQFPGAPAAVRFQEALRALMDRLAGGLIEGTVGACQSAGVTDLESVRRHRPRLASLTPEAAAATAALKRFLFESVYDSAELSQARARSAAMIEELFDYYAADPARMPDNYSRAAATVPVSRVVCDYIAGMTDRYCLRAAAAAGLTGLPPNRYGHEGVAAPDGGGSS
jgi:dGTPase